MNTGYEKMKNFKGKYATEGAYHLDLKGFKAWFHEDNCKVIANECQSDHHVIDLGCGSLRRMPVGGMCKKNDD